jgi:hypothetical protein
MQSMHGSASIIDAQMKQMSALVHLLNFGTRMHIGENAHLEEAAGDIARL